MIVKIVWLVYIYKQSYEQMLHYKW